MLTGVLAALLMRTAVSGSYQQYVASWMRWPLVATGLVLLALAVHAIWREEDHAHAEPSNLDPPRQP